MHWKLKKKKKKKKNPVPNKPYGFCGRKAPSNEKEVKKKMRNNCSSSPDVRDHLTGRPVFQCEPVWPSGKALGWLGTSWSVDTVL